MKWLAVIALLASLLPRALPCSCPANAWSRPRNVAIHEGFCWTQDVFLGTVLSVTCTCAPPESSEGLNCQRYALEGAQVVGEETLQFGAYTEDCFNPYGVSDCSDVASRVTPDGYTMENITSSAPPVHNITDCYTASGCTFEVPEHQDWWWFGSDSADGLPCVYIIHIDAVYKGDFQVGDNITSTGPDVLTSCGWFGRQLTLGTQYLQGIGGVCSPIPEWGELSDFNREDLNYLSELSAQYGDDPSVCDEQPSPVLEPTIFLSPTLVSKPTPTPMATRAPPPPTSCSSPSTSCPVAPPPTSLPRPTVVLDGGTALLPTLTIVILTALTGLMLV